MCFYPLRARLASCALVSCLACGCDEAQPAGAALDGGSGLSDDASEGTGDAAAPLACEVNAPSACPSPAPTFETVEPIIEARCVPCHDGRGDQWPLTSYTDVADWYDLIRAMVLECTMPPPDSGVLMPTSEREQILAWIRCGYPEK